MEKQELLRLFLGKGLQLDYESLEYFFQNQQKINVFLEKISLKEKPAIITQQYVFSIMNEESNELEIVKTPVKIKKNVSVEDVTKILNTRYSVLKKILTSRLDLVNPISINKINPKLKHFSAIIMIKEKFDDEIEITGEDETGEFRFFFTRREDFDQVRKDDVIGVICENEGRTTIKTIIWPDLQMTRKINKTVNDVRVAVASTGFDSQLGKEIFEKKKDLNYLIFVDNDGKATCLNKSVTAAEYPCFIKIEKNIMFLIANLRFLRESGDVKENQNEIILFMLKRRNLKPTFALNNDVFKEDPYLIDTVPDVFIMAGAKSNSSVNYKGTTIITVSDFKADRKIWVINLKTREAIILPVE